MAQELVWISYFIIVPANGVLALRESSASVCHHAEVLGLPAAGSRVVISTQLLGVKDAEGGGTPTVAEGSQLERWGWRLRN